MTVVVADTSPLNYLALIGEIRILRTLYGRVVAPPEVLAELADGGAPPEVAGWIQSRPEWLEVRSVRRGQDEPTLPQLDPGERAAYLAALDHASIDMDIAPFAQFIAERVRWSMEQAA
jgi:predicted nucleic acid-binding protein